ncbi:LAGLIDADG family homing endonuclease [Trueperella sp. LYQ143]|uniref:LAGLIDADG family homing endonuclease n=1 Tax=Trueperella sp. LYQ143 TaxID=3391059 RepID=UPI003983B8C9
MRFRAGYSRVLDTRRLGGGWFEVKGTANYGSISRGLIDDVQLLLRSLGYPSVVYDKVNKKYGRKRWTLALTAYDSHRFASARYAVDKSMYW